MIVEMFQRSAFGLTFETEDILGYRLQSEVLRALSIDLKKQTVEYEITQKGLPTKRRTEYSPNLNELIKKLPLTTDAFDGKFQGLRISEHGVSVANPKQCVPRSREDDPWDMTSYFDNTNTGKFKNKSGLKLADE